VSAPEVEEYVFVVEIDPKKYILVLRSTVYSRKLSCSANVQRDISIQNLNLEEYCTNLRISCKKAETKASITRVKFLAAIESLIQ